MQNQLNYYSRYNRIKIEDKKEIPSLYSLLSLQTLTKLAHDASVSLQMISLYKKEKLYRSVDGDHQADQNEYLQANNLFTFRSFQSESVDRKISRNHKKRQSVHITKKKTKFNQKKQKLQKQAYLQSLVREIRSKSIERLQGNSPPKEQIRRQKKSKKKNMISSKENLDREDQNNGTQNYLNDSHEKYDDQKNQNKVSQIDEKKIHKKLIKSLVSDQDKSIKQSIHKSKYQEQSIQGRKQYVESIDDGNERQLSGPSIVLERLNFKGTETHSQKLKDHIKQKIINKMLESQSKEDNPSSNDGKQSEIKSFSKEIQILKKPFKNLIQLQLNHSQSQIWQPTERSLQIPSRQFQVQEKDLYQNKNQIIFQPVKIIQANQKDSLPIQEDSSDNIIECHQPIQIQSEIQQHEQIYQKVSFLSQINQQKQVQQPPYQHPLQKMIPQPSIFQQKFDTPTPVKKSFKKFILNKELNPRLVTSTILNERNQRYLNLNKQKSQNQIDENQNQKSQLTNGLVGQKSQKVNFKALMKKKKQACKQQNLSIKQQKHVPLRKLQNQKLLQAFFNNN